jgi:phosphoenolpyruvate synthase/pyruvate phosphate dikinase
LKPTRVNIEYLEKKCMSIESKNPLILRGMAASPGTVIAPVWILDDSIDPTSFPEGAVLVAHTTNPSLVRFMIKASAIVTEIGGRLSHTAIVALELGIPCVVAVENARQLLPNGLLVHVDGDNGKVSLIQSDYDK